MSPTSYQTAPPRNIMVAQRRDRVKFSLLTAESARGVIISMMPADRTKRIAAVSAAGIVVLASAYYFASGSRSATSKLVPFVPPVYTGAVLAGEQSGEVQGGQQRIHIYSVKAATEDVLGFYRKELMAR